MVLELIALVEGSVEGSVGVKGSLVVEVLLHDTASRLSVREFGANSGAVGYVQRTDGHL